MVCFGILLTGLACAQPARLIRLSFQGQVGSPGVVQISDGEPWPMIRALAKAGGLNECAAWDRIRVERDGQTLVMSRYSKQPLKDGDVIQVDQLRGTLVRTMQPPQKIDLTHRSLPGLLGGDFPQYRGMVVHYSPDTGAYRWRGAEFFDGGNYKRSIDLEDEDLIVLSHREPTRTVEASIAGEVLSPGAVRCPVDSSLLGLLSAAGEFLPNADLGKIVLQRHGRNQIVGDILSLSTMKLLPQDCLKIQPLTHIRVRVWGEVRKEGEVLVPLQSSDILAEALEAAGGVEETAATQRILLWGHRRNLSLDATKGSTAIQNGDTLIVEPKRYFLWGEVTFPGEVPLNGGETLSSAVRARGAQDAKLDQVKILRAADIARKNYRWETYDLETGSNVVIGDGDYIYVPKVDNEYPPLFLQPYWNYPPSIFKVR